MKISVSQSQARQFLLQHQLLLPPQTLHGEKAVGRVFDYLRIIQYDPLNPCGRNPDLVLQSRISDYHPDGYHRWLYQEKKGIECYDKELCIIPIEDFSLTDHRRLLVKDRTDNKYFLKKYDKAIHELFARIQNDGEITSNDIKDTTRVTSDWGTDALFGRIALETLWRMGRLVISRREKGKKYYDLPGNVHTSLHEEVELGSLELTTNHLRRRLKSVGLLPLGGGGGGWQGLGSVRKVIKQLVDEGGFIEVCIKNIDRHYVVSRDDEKAIISKPHVLKTKKVTFIAPLDNLMWDRQMILELFNFHYRWEVYTPVAIRKYGYYVLPILYGEEFIGRIEPVLKKDRTLEIRGLWKEEGKVWDEQTHAAFKKALDIFKEYAKSL